MSVPPLPFLSSLPSIPLLLSGKSQPGAGRLPPLSVGEIVRGHVVESRGAGPVIISVKGSLLGAHSNHPLRQGETLTLLVQKLHPQVLFRLLGAAKNRSHLLAYHLAQHRIDPRALLKIFTEAETVLRGEGLNALVRSLGKTDADLIMSFMRALIVSRETLDRGFHFRDYLEKFGFLMENQLARALKQKWGRGGAARNAGENLKAFLMSAEGRIRASGESDQALLRFLGSSIRAVETSQVLNSILREQDQALLFQVPLSLAERVGLADVFIRFSDDEPGKDGGGGGQFTVHFFFDLDSLGPLAVEAGMAAGRIGCIITCEKPEAALFLEPFTGELRESLEAAGLVPDGISCSLGPARRVAEEIRESMENFPALESVDVKA